jgi:hypothetical protein
VPLRRPPGCGLEVVVLCCYLCCCQGPVRDRSCPLFCLALISAPILAGCLVDRLRCFLRPLLLQRKGARAAFCVVHIHVIIDRGICVSSRSCARPPLLPVRRSGTRTPPPGRGENTSCTSTHPGPLGSPGPAGGAAASGPYTPPRRAVPVVPSDPAAPACAKTL